MFKVSMKNICCIPPQHWQSFRDRLNHSIYASKFSLPSAKVVIDRGLLKDSFYKSRFLTFSNLTTPYMKIPYFYLSLSFAP